MSAPIQFRWLRARRFSLLHLIAAVYCLSFMGCTFVGFYRGIGLMQIPFMGTTIQISIRVIFSYLLIGSLGLRAVALSTGIGWVSVVCLHIGLYLWKKKKFYQMIGS